MIKRKHQPVIHLYQKDFEFGTYRITQPGKYILQEDIVFHPNPEDDFMPTPAQKDQYPSSPGPYNLGFFAAITIETSNVDLDLNNHTIQQSVEFYLRQRFFNTISLSSSPFIPTQGPGKFGPTIQSAKHSRIYNGTLGLTSHSGIHGNGNIEISIKDITIENFEVGGITLNGAQNISISNTTIYRSLGTQLKVPFNGRFSSSVFLLRALQQAIRLGLHNNSIQYGQYKETTLTLHGWLKNIIDLSIRHVIDQGLEHAFTEDKLAVSPILAESYYYFGNPSGKPDGSAVYGILFNRIGIAVNEFGACSPDCEKDSNVSKSIQINNVAISHLVLEPREVVGLHNSSKPGKFQTDFSGSLILISSGSWFEHNNVYQPDTTFIQKNRRYPCDKILLSQVHLFEMAQETGQKSIKGVAHIESDVLDWVHSGNTIYKGTGSTRNTDIMAHVMKGIVGIRLDSVYQIQIDRVSIGDLINTGPPGISYDTGSHPNLEGYLDGETSRTHHAHDLHLGHSKSSDVDRGYTANFVRGISSIYVYNARMKNIGVSRLTSRYGTVCGVDVMRYNKTHLYSKINIDQLSSGPFISDSIVPFKKSSCVRLPNITPRTVGLLIRMNNTNIELQHISVNSIQSTDLSESIVMESPCQLNSLNMPNQSQPKSLQYQINSSGNIEDRNFT